MGSFQLSPAQLDTFHRDGYLIVPGLFAGPMVEMLMEVARQDPEFIGRAHVMEDAAGRGSRIAFTVELPRNVYGAFVHSQKILTPMEQILGGEVYHLHHKMMLKEPRVGGAWEWHQDYGYWYNDAFLFPDLASCMIAVDRAHKGNGCLQVLQGSHLLGRVEHGKFGGQTGADPDRVRMAQETLRLVHVEMDPGSACFFHCNTLHSSAPNTSDDPRWSLICCYAAARNQPYRRSHAAYQKLEPWSDEQVMEEAKEQLAKIKGGA